MPTFTAKPQTLAAAVGWAAKWLPNKPANPIQAGLKLDLDDGGLTITAMSESVTARATLDVQADGQSSQVVSGRLFAELVKTLPDKAITVHTEGGRVVLSAGRFTATLPSMAIKDFPDSPDVPDPIGSVTGDELADAIIRVGAAAGRDLTATPSVLIMRLGFGPERVELLTTDRYRCAIETLPWKPAGEVSAVATVMGVTMLDVAAACAGPDEVVVGLDGSLLSFTTPTRSLVLTQMVVAGYPDEALRRQVMTDLPAAATFKVRDMAMPLKRAALLTARDAPVVLSIGGNVIVVKADAAELEQGGADEIDSDYDGTVTEITVKPSYLEAVLHAIPGDTARLAFTPGAYKPLLVTAAGDDAYRHIIMPIRKI